MKKMTFGQDCFPQSDQYFANAASLIRELLAETSNKYAIHDIVCRLLGTPAAFKLGELGLIAVRPQTEKRGRALTASSLDNQSKRFCIEDDEAT